MPAKLHSSPMAKRPMKRGNAEAVLWGNQKAASMTKKLARIDQAAGRARLR